MKRTLATVSLLVGLCAGIPRTALANTVLTGEHGNAFYKIEVPDSWNGDLVIWNHGFSLAPVGPAVSLGPLAALQLAEGYAVAASSYRMSGWALFKTNEDLETLYQTFVEEVGTPGQVLVTGGSMGGAVTAAALEDAELGNVTGALTLCGALAGSRNWDGAVDARLLYDATCSAVPGAFIPGGAEGLPAGSTLTTNQMTLAVNACFGLLPAPFPPPTPAQQQRLAAFLAVTQLPPNFVLTVMGHSTFGLADLVHDKLNGRPGTGTAGVSYGDPYDALIERVAPHPGAENRLFESWTPTGAVGEAKIVSLHTDKDGLAIVENESEYASVVPSANLTTAVAVEAVATHCGFTGAEMVAAWEALRGWVAGGPQPSAAVIKGVCTAVAPMFGGPCRIDPAFVIPDMDIRVRPR